MQELDMWHFNFFFKKFKKNSKNSKKIIKKLKIKNKKTTY